MADDMFSLCMGGREGARGGEGVQEGRGIGVQEEGRVQSTWGGDCAWGGRMGVRACARMGTAGAWGGLHIGGQGGRR